MFCGNPWRRFHVTLCVTFNLIFYYVHQGINKIKYKKQKVDYMETRYYVMET